MARTALAGLLVCVLALTGCAALADIAQLREDLGEAGYDAGRIQHQTNNGATSLSIAVAMDGEPAEEDAERIAEVAWTTYPDEFEVLRIWINQRLALEESHDDLLGRFGERPEGLAGDDSGSPLTLILVAAGIAVVFTALMVLLWRRGRRSPTAAPPVASPGHQPGGHHQYPPQPPQG